MVDKAKAEWVEKAVEKMGWSIKEAESVWESDHAIDKGKAQDFDLPPDKLKIAKTFAKTGTRKAPTAYKLTPRERKSNPTKASIIAELATFLKENSENAVENLEILNAERQISFQIGENSFELTLTQKRKPKK